MPTVQCVLGNRPGLYATPIAYYVCGVRGQRIHENISTKSSKIAIRENLDPRKFSAIRYPFVLPERCGVHMPSVT